MSHFFAKPLYSRISAGQYEATACGQGMCYPSIIHSFPQIGFVRPKIRFLASQRVVYPPKHSSPLTLYPLEQPFATTYGLHRILIIR